MSFLDFERTCIVVAAGPSGVGKTTFFASRCPQTSVVSADMFRGLLSDDENNQDGKLAKHAFGLLYRVVERRAALGLPTVLDTTALKLRARERALQTGRKLKLPVHIVVFDGDKGLCRAGQQERGVRIMPPGVDDRMQADLQATLRAVDDEGFASVTVLSRRDAAAVQEVRFGGEVRSSAALAPRSENRPAGPMTLSLGLLSGLFDDGMTSRDPGKVRTYTLELLRDIVAARLALGRFCDVETTGMSPADVTKLRSVAPKDADVTESGALLSIRPVSDEPVVSVPQGDQFDVIGDVHGCYDELVELLETLGYRADGGVYRHPSRTAVFVGDFTDRGPRSVDTLKLIFAMLDCGAAVAVRGNHDDKLMRWAKGSNVTVSHGLEKTVAEIDALGHDEQLALRDRIVATIGNLPYQLVLDDGRLVVVHGGLKPWMVGRSDMGRKKGPIASICLYGEADGFLPDGRPNRLDFTRDWDLADVTLVYGHQVFDEVRVSGPHGTCNGIDTGCAFGGALTALRWPQQEIVQVQAAEDYDSEQVPA